MNKIVFEHYPVANLPDDLREGLSRDGTVRVVIEAEAFDDRQLNLAGSLSVESSKPMTALEVVEAIRRFKAEGRPSVSSEEAVARIRELRDEWED
ncbi:hypothetical protein HGO38_09105 [Rhizobium sp. CG5]|uniref:hypothetical protein n=1 Tax=Rhizobium sp. CG5 TaxID=2726076 RepID=UPI002033FE19|nr:hypothetical protein [Rhizobium sp. CG5]MCM2473636.1 hypothetical protein [Rhizobium sp. CG5]